MQFLEQLKALNLPTDKFAIFGSGPMAIRSIRETRDLDIIVTPDLWEILSKEHAASPDKFGCIQIGDIEIYNHWGVWFQNMTELINEADVIDGLKYVKLERVLEWKKAFNREKDKKDIELINNFLKNE